MLNGTLAFFPQFAICVYFKSGKVSFVCIDSIEESKEGDEDFYHPPVIRFISTKLLHVFYKHSVLQSEARAGLAFS